MITTSDGIFVICEIFINSLIVVGTKSVMPEDLSRASMP